MPIGKNQGRRTNRKIKGALNQALVMVTMYVKFNVHSSNAKQVMVLNVVDRWTLESDVNIRHILTSKDDPRAEIIKIFIMAIHKITYITFK